MSESMHPVEIVERAEGYHYRIGTPRTYLSIHERPFGLAFLPNEMNKFWGLGST